MIVCVDVGGTKTLVTRFDNGGVMTVETKIATPRNQSNFVVEIKTILDKLRPSEFTCISLGVPGMVDENGEIMRCGNLPWKNFPLQAIIADTYKCPVFVQNDANLAGLAEAHSLPDMPPLCLYVTIGTGIGTGIIIHGKLDVAVSHSESGHMVLSTPDGPKIWQHLASGRAIAKRFGRMASEITDPEVWREIAKDMALGFQVLIPVLQPDIVIIGGSIGGYFERYETFLRENLIATLPEMIALPQIQQAVHPEEAVVYGAYFYATQVRHLEDQRGLTLQEV